ncbi:Hypothetical protein NCS54_00199700 [Fusarium falciforme]|uniref:Hypothetical protein n=1 Tax=Fusarium falciforme TaxID=195108 RepID=UPI0023012621|nr:Hypothetical protein NCS54_00199700 [Fusarium falciforme]WAO84773.1 Hypothetical protein NCS54_00199700 [Fusarium falciforme]
MAAPPPYSPPASISRHRTGSDDVHSLADALLRTSVSSDSATSTSTTSTILPPYPTSRERSIASSSSPSSGRSDDYTSGSLPGHLHRLRSPGSASTSGTTSGTRERLRQIEMERDELRRAMDGERAQAAEMRRLAEQERAISERLRMEAALSGPSAADARRRVQELKREALAARSEKPKRSNDGMFKKAYATDLLFLMDTTGSMYSYIKAARDQVKRIMDDITKAFFNEAEVRIAVVGYKDHADKPNIQFLDFTTSIDDVRSFIDKFTASGGGDAPEDVLGGIDQAINATWKNQTRCIIHIADAPAHGRIFHDFSDSADDYPEPGSEPHRLTYQPLFKKMIDMNINYALLRIKNATDRMALTFMKEYAAISSDCKLLVSNQYYDEGLKATLALRGASSSKGTAKGDLVFEEAELGTSYSALRHLVVRSVTTSASRTAVRMSTSSSRTGGKGGTKNPLTTQLQAIEEDEDKVEEASEMSLEKVPPQWDTPGWLNEKLILEGFSPDTVVHGADTLNAMMAHDDNIRLSIMELTINKRSRPFSQGALRLTAYARTAASTNRYVVKSFKRDGKRLAHLAEDMRCQALCKAFALEFNALVGDKHAIDFIVTTCLRGKTTTSGTDCMSLEPYIEGEYVKYNNNCSYVNDDNPKDEFNQAAQAFSHFTFERSWGSFLVCDLQGVGHVLTDPAIHTLDPERFKLADTNLGKDGFKFFFATHACNEICEKLELRSTAAGIASNNCEFRELWPSIDNTVCCSNKLCGKIVRVSSAKKSEEYPGCHWCDVCWPQLSSSKVKWMCVAPGPHHEFDVSKFYYESQGQIPPRKCPDHRERDTTVSRTAVMGGSFFSRLKGANKQKNISGKAW